MRFLRSAITALLALAAVLVMLTALPRDALTAPTLLYDVDFSSPPHTVGMPPVTGAGAAPRDTVSSIDYGTPTVVASFGSLTDLPLEFNSFDGHGDNILLDLWDLPPQSSYTLEAEVLIEDGEAPSPTEALFSIHLDTPFIRAVDFRANGKVAQSIPYVPGAGEIGTFTFGTKIAVRIEVDLVADSWQIFLDGSPVHAGAFGGATEVTRIRFTTEVIQIRPLRALVSAAIDNIRICSASCPPTPTPTPTPTPIAVGGIVELVTAPDAPPAGSQGSDDSKALMVLLGVGAMLVLGTGGLYAVKLRRG